MEWKITCCRSDRSHETELNQQIHTRRKVGFCLFYFLCGNSHTGFKQSSLLQLFAWFCTCILPHRKRNCRWTPKSRLCWNTLQRKWEAVAKLLPCCCHAKSESKREKVKLRKCCCYAVTMLLPCCCHAVTIFCTHILSHRKRNCRATVAMLLPCSCNTGQQQPFAWAYVGLSTCFLPRRKRNCRWIFCVVYVVNENFLMYLLHRKQNCRWTTAEVPLLGRIIFSKIVSQCFDKSFKLNPCCLAPHNDRLLPTDYQALQHNWDLGKCARLLMSKWTWMRQSLTFATLLSVFFAPCSILKKRQPAVF